MSIHCFVENIDDISLIEYIIDAFHRSSLKKLDISVQSIDQMTKDLSEDATIIFYGEQRLHNNAIYIPKRHIIGKETINAVINAELCIKLNLNENQIPIHLSSCVQNISDKNGDQILQTLNNETLIYRSTENSKLHFEFDIFFEIFRYISHYDEHVLEKQQGIIYPYTFLLDGTKNPHIPVVNYLFVLLEELIFGDEEKTNVQSRTNFNILLSHDLDYIKKTPILRIKRLLFYSIKALNNMKCGNWSPAINNIKKGLTFFFTFTNYWRFEDICKLERKYDIRSIVFVYANAESFFQKGLKNSFIDPEYSLSHNAKLQEQLRIMHGNGWMIGIHGSAKAYRDPELFTREVEILASVINSPIIANRNHWLNFSHQHTIRSLELGGIKNDSTLGYNDTPGFRGGICSPYRIFDWENKKASDVIEIPMVIMDGSIYDYNDDIDIKRLFSLLHEVKIFNGTVAINWHQRTIAEDYGWYGMYEQLLNWIKENGGRCLTLE